VTDSRVVVVGGGLAGLTAALACADAGAQVTLLEAKPRLGGLTYSFRRGDLTVDNGQHVFLRCCTHYLGLLDRLGVRDKVFLQDRLDVPIVDAATGARHRLRRNDLPAPLHLAGAVARFGALSPVQRLSLVRAMRAMQRVDRQAPATDATSFGSWLRRHGQSDRAFEAVWDLIGVATLNAHADDASLSMAATVFQVGLLEDQRAGDLGWSRVPLQHLHGDPAAAELARLGADVRLGSKVEALTAERTVVVRDGEELTADALVLAVPAQAAARLLPAGAVSLPSGWADRLGGVPIVNVHLSYDRRLLDEPFLAGLGSAVPWVFDCTERTGTSAAQALTVPISAAQRLVDVPVAELRAVVEAALADLLPRTRQARLLEFFVTREREATFSPAAGNGALRPSSATAIPGLALAGAWTDTGWPATMEGAVRSGEAAASVVLSHLAIRSGDRLAASTTDGVRA